MDKQAGRLTSSGGANGPWAVHASEQIGGQAIRATGSTKKEAVVDDPDQEAGGSATTSAAEVSTTCPHAICAVRCVVNAWRGRVTCVRNSSNAWKYHESSSG